MTKEKQVQILDALTKIELEAKKAYVMAGDLNSDLVDNSWDDITAEKALALSNADAKFNIMLSAMHSVLETCQNASDDLKKEEIVENMKPDSGSQWIGLPAWTAGKNVEIR